MAKQEEEEEEEVIYEGWLVFKSQRMNHFMRRWAVLTSNSLFKYKVQRKKDINKEIIKPIGQYALENCYCDESGDILPFKDKFQQVYWYLFDVCKAGKDRIYA